MIKWFLFAFLLGTIDWSLLLRLWALVWSVPVRTLTAMLALSVLFGISFWGTMGTAYASRLNVDIFLRITRDWPLSRISAIRSYFCKGSSRPHFIRILCRLVAKWRIYITKLVLNRLWRFFSAGSLSTLKISTWSLSSVCVTRR